MPLGAGDMETNEKFCCQAIEIDITPQKPVALVGQYYHRLATEVYSPLCANILVLRKGKETVIFVACEWLGVPEEFIEYAKSLLLEKVPGFPTDSVIFSATHTHTAPYVYDNHGSKTWGKDFDWVRTNEEEMSPEEYRKFSAERITDGILKAYCTCVPAVVSTDIRELSISFNRRTVYADGSAVMYGNTNRDDFVRMEGISDNGVHLFALEDLQGKLIAAVIEIACPSQVLEHHCFVSSDYWNEVRIRLKALYGETVTIVGLCGAAGDLSPRDLVRAAMPEPEMHSTKMYQPEGTFYLADMITAAFQEFMGTRTKQDNPQLQHLSRVIELPLWTVTEKEYLQAEKAYQEKRALHEQMKDFTEAESYTLSIDAGVVIRWEEQQKSLTHPVEIHTVKLGDALLATNPFELFVEYADRIRSRSNCQNTVVVQLTGGYQGYLPSAVAVEHGGYSALVCNGLYASDGGDKLVAETLDMIGKMQ